MGQEKSHKSTVPCGCFTSYVGFGSKKSPQRRCSRNTSGKGHKTPLLCIKVSVGTNQPPSVYTPLSLGKGEVSGREVRGPKVKNLCHVELVLDRGELTITSRNSQLLQGSLHCTPEHCLVNGGFPFFWWKKPCFKLAKCIS